MTNTEAASDLESISDWSEPLHLAFLSRPFVPRPLAREENSDGTKVGSLLIKLLPHTPSLTLGVLVLPLSTVSPLYEGLSLRTLQRRIKRTPASHPGEGASQASRGDESALFADLVGCVERVLQGQDGAQRWLECDIGRGEAALTLHHSSATSDFLVSFDLSSLDREDGPKVVRDHLLLPLASLASSEETPAPGSNPLVHLLDNRQGATRLMNAGERLAGRPSTTLERASSSPQIDVSKPVPREPTSPLGARSPTLSASRTHEQSRSIPASRDQTPSRSSTTPRTPSSTTRTNQAATRTVMQHDDDDDDEEEIVIFNPTPTSSSHRSRRPGEGEKQRRLDAQSPTPRPQQTTGGRRLFPAKSGKKDGPDRGADEDGENGEEADEEEEEELTLTSNVSRGAKAASGSQRGHTDAADSSGQGDDTTRASSSPQAPRRTDNSKQRHSPLLPLLPPASTFESMPATPMQVDPADEELPSATAPTVPLPPTSLTHGEVVDGPAGGGTGGRGTSRYTRGLAKRKRI